MLKGKNRINLSESAYQRIKDAIYSGSIVSGDILSENHLAGQLGMSRTPVREALHTLASEGFVEIRNGIGAYVKPLSSKDIEDLYEVRCLMEIQAVKTSIYRITDAEIDEFAAEFQETLEAFERGERLGEGEFTELDWRFHALLVERCTNPYIKAIVKSNDANLRRYQSLSIAALNDTRESIRQHMEIIRCLRERDLQGAIDTLGKHLNWAASLLHIAVGE